MAPQKQSNATSSLLTDPTFRYRSASLKELAEKVAQQGNREALEKILRRTIFHTAEKPRLRFTEYLDSLRIRASTRTWRSSRSFETADRAYDITLDKFSNLPFSDVSSEGKSLLQPKRMKRNGPDCRLYWRAFLEHIQKGFEKDPPMRQLDAEKRAATALQRFVQRHFFLSLLEAERNANEFWSRYNWRLENCSILLWMPRFLKGAERRKWLKKNVRDPNPNRPGERERIQAVIGRKFGTMAFVQMRRDIGMDPTASIIGKLSGDQHVPAKLARHVAKEKSADIENQRRSIRKLGKKKLQSLILRIFADLEADTFQDQQVAKDFGISKATFSRFAGSKWYTSRTKSIPDLWLNTAQVLAAHDEFKEAAAEAGVFANVEKLLKNAKRK